MNPGTQWQIDVLLKYYLELVPSMPKKVIFNISMTLGTYYQSDALKSLDGAHLKDALRAFSMGVIISRPLKQLNSNFYKNCYIYSSELKLI